MVKVLKEHLIDETFTKNIFIVYHHIDTDGRCGGAILRYYCEKIIGVIPKMIPYNHKESLDWLSEINSGDTVLMVDIALPYKEMGELNEKVDLYWFDHHISSIKEMSGLKIKGTRTTEDAGCGIAYKNVLRKHLKEDVIKDVDSLITLISDYDNWNVDKYGKEKYKEIPSAVSVFMGSININPKDDDGYSKWVRLFETGLFDGKTLSEILERGKILQLFQDKISARLMKKCAFEIEFEGYNAIVCFGVKNSQAFDSVYDEDKHDIMIGIFVNNKKTYDLSFYSTKDYVDVSVIAKKYGGGGHKLAGGVQVKKIDFSGDTLILSEPII